MTHDKMLSFVSSMGKMGLQHFSVGGMALSGPTSTTQNPNTKTGGIAGGLSNFLGTSNGFQAQATPVQAGTNSAQLNNSYAGVQGALSAAQNNAYGLNNNTAQGSNTENTLTNAYTNQVNGTGPNPAQAELNQNTGVNIAQSAALAAGQRGGGANAGLIAENAARQGATTQQQAVGQAATLGAQQQIAAESNLQNLAGSEIAQGTGATQALNSAQQNEQNILQGANTSFNNANVTQQDSINNVNAGISTGNANTSGNIVSGIGSGLSSAASFVGGLFADGGKVPPAPWKKMAAGGVVGQTTSAPQSYVGNWLNSSVNTAGPTASPVPPINTAGANPFAFVGSSPKGASKPAAPAARVPDGSQSEDYKNLDDGPAGNGSNSADYKNLSDLNPNEASPLLANDPLETSGPNALTNFSLAAEGGVMGKVPGKSPVNRDSYSNDKVPALLSPGEVVIDLNTLKDPGPLGKKARFVAASIERVKAKKGKAA